MIWLRKTEEVELDYYNFPFPAVKGWQDYTYQIFYRQYLIGFCGKLYPVIELNFSDKYQICFNLSEIDDFVAKHLKTKYVEEYRRKKSVWHKQRVTKRHYFEKWFEECQQKDYNSWFIEAHCPVFLVKYAHKKASITYNPSLREWEFVRIFDPYMAFQEISMYYGGVLGGIKEHVPDVPDKVLAEAKGFDKWSFRKEKS